MMEFIIEEERVVDWTYGKVRVSKKKVNTKVICLKTASSLSIGTHRFHSPWERKDQSELSLSISSVIYLHRITKSTI